MRRSARQISVRESSCGWFKTRKWEHEPQGKSPKGLESATNDLNLRRKQGRNVEDIPCDAA